MTTSRLTNQFLCSTAINVESHLNAPDGSGGSYQARPKTNPNYTTLEPRVLFDAAMAESHEAVVDANEVVLAGQQDADHDILLAALGVDLLQTPAALPFQQVPIVFIDGAVEDIDVLIADIGPHAEIHILDSNADGVEQIAAVLAGRTDIESLHIISHGRSGTLDLGDTKLTAVSMAGEYADEMAVIAASLGNNADILIYGCDFAAGARGREAVALIAALTGADVAASHDLTGAAELGGDWVLEQQVGFVETGMLRLDSWSGTLGLVNTGNWTVSGSTATNTTAGITSTITFTPTAGGTVAVNATPQVFNTSTGLFTNGAEGDASLGFTYTWDTTPDAATGVPQPDASANDAPMTVTITFSTPVTNPVINIDRLGGNGTFDPDSATVGGEDSRSNSSLWTLTTPGAMLVELAGVGHFDVTSTTFQRTPNQVMALTDISGEASTNALNSTAAGSVQVMGTFTTLTFIVSGVGVEGAGADGIEIGLSLDAPPIAQNDTFTMTEDATLAGNLFANNGAGVDADPTADAITITEVNGAPFIVNTPIAVTNGTVTITNAATGAFTFMPSPGYVGPASFAFTIADANGGSDTATASITVLADTDADGVADANDIDDDNDGIIDTAEGYSLTTQKTALNFIQYPVHITSASVGALFDGNTAYTGNAALRIHSFVITPGDLNGSVLNNALVVGTTTNAVFPAGSSFTMHLENDDVIGDSAALIAASLNSGLTSLGLNPLSLFNDTFTDVGTIGVLDAADFDRNGDGLVSTSGVDYSPMGVIIQFYNGVPGAGGTVVGTTFSQVKLLQAGGVQVHTAVSPVPFTHFAIASVPDGTGKDIRINELQFNGQVNTGTPTFSVVNEVNRDSDGDGFADHLDLDSDNVGITDNVEAQTTAGYIAPSGTGPLMGDTDNDGLDNVFDATVGIAGSLGLTPVNTDGTDAADYLDADSDNDGVTDIVERGDGQATSITSTTDSDRDGLLDIFEAGTVADGYDVNDSNLIGANFNLSDTDNDTAANGAGAVPLFNNLDYRDSNEPPVAADDSFFINEEQTISSNVITGNGIDTDPDSDPLTVTSASIDSNGDGTADTLAIGTTTALTGPGGFLIGSITLTSTGLLTFVPAPNYNGPVPVLNYTISDGHNQTSSATVNITITPVNDAPVAVDDGPVAVTEDTPATGNVIADAPGIDTDVDPDALTVSTFMISGDPTIYTAGSTATIPGVGTLVIGPTGAYTFTPELNYNGPVPSATYTITDGVLTDEAVLSFADIIDVNDAPVAVDDGPVPVTEDTPVSGNVITSSPGADSDVDGDALTVTTFVVDGDPTVHTAGATATIPGVGTLVVGSDGSYAFTPELNYNGPVPSATYTITDGTLTDAAVLSFADITDVNDAPVAENNTNSIDEDTVAAGNVITDAFGADRDVDGDELTVTSFEIDTDGDGTPETFTAGDTAMIAGVGTLLVSPDGSYSFTPEANYSGPVPVVSYTVTDGVLTDTATLSLNITPVNDPPVNPPGDQLPPVSIIDDTTVSLPLPAGSFTNPDGGILTYSLATGAPAWLSIDPDTGEITGTVPADASVNGTYVLTVIATNSSGGTASAELSVTVINLPPVAADELSSNTEDTPQSGNVLSNDMDTAPDNDPLTVAEVNGSSGLVGQPLSLTYGDVTINPDGSWTFTPNAAANGLATGEKVTETISYRVSDGQGGFADATLTIEITGLNDAPEVQGLVPDQSGSDGESITPIDVGLVFTDPDGDPLTYTATGLPPGLFIDPDIGVITGMLEPDASQGGPYSVTVTSTDPDGDTATTTFNWAVLNPPPIVESDFASTDEDLPVLINVLGNDSDPDGDPLTIIDTTPPANGTVTINPDGSITYTPNPGFNGTDTFTYTLEDGDGGTSTATVTVVVGPVNDSPLASTIPTQSDNDGEIITPLAVSAAFTDPDGDDLDFTAEGLPPGLVIDPETGIISGTLEPGASQNGPYTITITATDLAGFIAATSFVWNVGNLPPVAVDDAASTDEDTPSTGNVLTGAGNDLPGSGVDNDTAPDNDPLTVAAANQAGVPLIIGVPFTTIGGGVLTLNADGSYSFNPGKAYDGLALGETATETISYMIADGNGGSDTAQLVITIEGANDGPVVVDPDLPINPTDPQPAPDPFDIIPDVTTTDGATPPAIDVEQYFVDPDGEKLTFAATGLPPGLAFNPATGLIEGTLLPGASQGGPANTGVYLVTVAATDPNGVTSLSTLVYTVGNLPPVAVDDVSTGNEDNPQSGNVLTGPVTSDADTPPDSDPLEVSGISGGAVGAPLVLTYGTLVMQSNGAWVFTPNAAANALTVGVHLTETVTYTVSDGNGGTDTAVLTIGVDGVNDSPTGTALPGQTDFEGDDVEIDISTVFDDPDGDTLTFTATGLPPGLVVDPASGLITGSPAPGSSYNGPYSVVITANDGHGGTVSLAFTWVINDLPASGPVVPDEPLPVQTWQSVGTENIQPFITRAVNGLAALGGSPELADHAITRAILSLGDLNSAIDLVGGDGVITRLVE